MKAQPMSTLTFAMPAPDACGRGARALAALMLAGGALLAGCTALPERPVRAAIYDFGPGLSATTAAARAADAPPIALAAVEAPAALDGTAVLYRLAYADAQQLRPYAQARWSMPPAQLLQQRLREHLGQQGPVLRAGEAGAARELRIELDEFSQLFESPQASTGLVRLRATLVGTGPAQGRLLAQRSVMVRRPAPSADAPGGVRALTAATDAAVEEIAQWLQQLR
jgi:cholesterol transport system auxiliary component